jgi:UDP-N-acetylmuramoylalanine--D-glutamate ligase
MRESTGSPRSVIVGLGRTGVSAARHLAARGHRLVVTDSRPNPPGLAELRRLVPAATTALGGFDPAVLEGADQVVVSPGVSLAEPFLRKAAAEGLDLVGDIELFAREAGGRVVGITGTNGKSTVTTLVGEFAKAAGVEARVGGNLGEPALDLLEGPPAAIYVLELSSYQLETTHSLQLEAAAVLNVTPDHLDRYRDLVEYAAAKARIFERAATAVVNLDDEIVVRMPRPGQRRVGFSLNRDDADFRLLRQGGAEWLAHGAEPILPRAELRLPAGTMPLTRSRRSPSEASAGSRAMRWRTCCAASAGCRTAPSACATGAASPGSTTRRAPTSARRSRRSKGSTDRSSSSRAATARARTSRRSAPPARAR